jgi:very-short-patch-repair endonuclease
MRVRAPVEFGQHGWRLRRDMSLPEVILCDCLSSRRVEAHWRRRYPAGPFVFDFFCPVARLAIEVDGAAHGHSNQTLESELSEAMSAEAQIIIFINKMHTLFGVGKADGVMGMSLTF